MFPLQVFVVAVLLFAHHGYSQRPMNSCVVKHTNTTGLCMSASQCQSARQDYQNYGIKPTFCNTSSIGTPIICCSGEKKPNKDPKTNLAEVKNHQAPGGNQRISEKKCAEYSSLIYKNVTIIPLVPGSEATVVSVPDCYYTGVELIVGSGGVAEGEFPHMAAIGWVNSEGNYSFLCDGSLISTKYVLTAAHCTYHNKMRNPNPAIVRLGDLDLDSTEHDGATPIEVPIKNIIKHPQYKPPVKYHDIALLELASDIDFDAAIRPACLWNKPNFPGYSKAVATGWGAIDPNARRTTNELQKVSLSLFENDHCNNLLRSKKNLLAEGFPDNQMCAGELRGGKDTCQGNSGSPLQVVSRENKCVFHIIGVMTFGFKCAQSGTPAVYTRVSSYLDWIESEVWPGEF